MAKENDQFLKEMNELKKNKQEFFIAVNLPELETGLTGCGLDKVILLDTEDKLDRFIGNKNSRNVLYIWYEEDDQKLMNLYNATDEDHRIILNNSNIVGYLASLLPQTGSDDPDDVITAPETFIEMVIGHSDDLISFPDRRGWVLHTDFTDRCGNCNFYFGPDARYCPRCGARRGEGRFEPFRNNTARDILYGSPMIRLHECPRCGTRWTTNSVGTGEMFCSNCGSKGDIIEEQEVEWWQDAICSVLLQELGK